MRTRTVSIVLCTYNGEKYIEEQLNSLINQTYDYDEIIVQDDASTDRTFDIVTTMAKKNSRIKIFRNSKALGINTNFFTAISKAKSEYIALSDQDDIWELDKIAIQMDAIGNNLLCTGRSVPFCENQKNIAYDWRYPNYNLIRLLYSSIPGHTMLFHRSLLNLIPHNHELYQHTIYDVILSITAASYNSIVFIDKKLVNQRRHITAATFQAHDKHRERSVNNLFYMIFWSVIHYSKIAPLMREHFRIRNSFLQEIHSTEQIYLDALKITSYHASKGLFPIVKLMMLYLKYRHVLFFSYEKDPIAIARVIVYPIMLIYNYRYLLKNV